jgi:hypothetical protein
MRDVLEGRLPLWGWLLFLFLDFVTKFLVMWAVGYPWGAALVGAGLSSPLATIVGLTAYHPFPKATTARYALIYFSVIVALKLLLGWMSGFTEVRGGVLLVQDGKWTFAGGLEKLLMAFCEAGLSTVVLFLLQGLIGERRRFVRR